MRAYRYIDSKYIKGVWGGIYFVVILEKTITMT